MSENNALAVCRDIDRPASVLALVLVATVTEAMLLILPFFVGAITDTMAISSREVALLSSADLAGIAISTVSATYWLRRVNWRNTLLGLMLILFVTNIVSMLVDSYLPLLLIRVFAGLIGGATYAIALAGLCETVKGDRNTALMVCGQVIFGALGSYVLPQVILDWRLDAIYLYMNVWLFLALILTFYYFRGSPVKRTVTESRGLGQYVLRGVAVVGGTSLYFLTVGAVWAYLERIARDVGMSSAEVGFSLGVGYAISLIGSLSAAVIGARLGRAWPMLIAGTVQVIALGLFARLSDYESPAMAFFVINAMFQFFWSYIIAYQIMIFSDVDSTGHFLPVYGTSMHLALALGPFAGSLMIDYGGYSSLLTFAMVTLSLCYAFFLLAILLNARFSLSYLTSDLKCGSK